MSLALVFNRGLCSAEYCHLLKNLNFSVEIIFFKFSCGGPYHNGVSLLVDSGVLITIVIVLQLENLKILGLCYSLNVFLLFCLISKAVA